MQQNVERVIEILRTMPHSEEDYYRVRAQKPRVLERKAARMIYLNRTGYNGLYRVNRSGGFNVPYGRYVRPKICDPDHLRAVSRALQGVTLLVSDFEKTVARARSGDVVYFDPPYVPVSKTARFAEYHREAFGEVQHQKLANLYVELSLSGVCTVLSNSDTPLTRKLFEDCEFDFVSARRSINSAAHRRGPLNEILVHRVHS